MIFASGSGPARRGEMPEIRSATPCPSLPAGLNSVTGGSGLARNSQLTTPVQPIRAEKKRPSPQLPPGAYGIGRRDRPAQRAGGESGGEERSGSAGSDTL